MEMNRKLKTKNVHFNMNMSGCFFLLFSLLLRTHREPHITHQGCNRLKKCGRFLLLNKHTFYFPPPPGGKVNKRSCECVSVLVSPQNQLWF